MKLAKYISVRSILKTVAVTVAVLLGIVWFFLDYLDETPLEQSKHYKITKKRALQLPQGHPEEQQLYAGWCKRNITPGFKCESVGYNRHGEYDKDLDSLFVLCLVNIFCNSVG